MAPSIDFLDPFNRIQPGLFIGKYSDWIIFTLLLFFFMSVVGIALRKKFEENRYFKTLVTSMGLILAVGTYYSIYRGWLHVSLQGMGFFGAVLIFVIVFFIIFGLLRGYGMHLSSALPLGYCLFYLSILAASPNFFQMIAEVFPPANGILLLLFFISIYKVVAAYLRKSKQSPAFFAKELKTYSADNENHGRSLGHESDREIDREIAEEKEKPRLLMIFNRLPGLCENGRLDHRQNTPENQAGCYSGQKLFQLDLPLELLEHLFRFFPCLDVVFLDRLLNELFRRRKLCLYIILG